MRGQAARQRLPLVAAAICGSGCEGVQSALAPAGPQAELIAGETWFLLWMTGAVFAVVTGGLLYGLLRRRAGGEPAVDDRGLARWVGGALAATMVLLLVNLVVDLRTGRALGDLAEPETLVVAVTGHRWWWEVQYEHANPSRRVTTANEIHIPVGRPVLVRLRSADVIHSFWVPRLHGKRDMIPGYTRSIWIQADAPGVYRGECAEFCGHQHANMALHVVASDPLHFERWYEAQLRPATEPASEAGKSGRLVFLSGPCVVCHTIRGTPAGGRAAPDLTHLASRRSIAAGTLPNRREQLGAWILDPHTVKPGVQMPANDLAPEDLELLLTYLQDLR